MSANGEPGAPCLVHGCAKPATHLIELTAGVLAGGTRQMWACGRCSDELCAVGAWVLVRSVPIAGEQLGLEL